MSARKAFGIASVLFVLMYAVLMTMPITRGITTNVSYLTIGSGGVALCYPYMVESGQLVNLRTGTTYSFWPGDAAIAASCSDGYILVVGLHGAYFISASGPSLEKFSEMWAGDLIGLSGDTAAYFVNGSIYVLTPQQDYVILPPPGSKPISYTVNSGVPEVLLYGNGTFALEFPVKSLVPLNITSYHPSGTVNVSLVVVQASNGTLYEMSETPYSKPTVVNTYTLPVHLSTIPVATQNYVIGVSKAGMILVQLQPVEVLQVLGNVTITPVGYYAPWLGYTYVFVDGSWVPVPGFAIGVLGQLAVVTDVRNATVLYPLYPTSLTAWVSLSGELVLGNYSLRVSMSPGTYALPSPSVLEMIGKALQLIGGSESYPPNITYPSRMIVLVYPSSGTGLETMDGVTYVAAGAGSLLVIRNGNAYVMTAEGTVLTLQGPWLYGGLGPAGVALYANGTIYVFNYQGQRVASYTALISYVPMIMSPYEIGGNYYVLLEGPGAPGNGTFYIFGPSGVTSFQAPLRVEDVGSGISVVYGSNGTTGYIEAGPVTIPIQVQRLYASVNGLTVSYRTPSGDYVLVDLNTGQEFVVLDAPDLQAYALGPYGLAVYNPSDTTLEIINVSELMQSEVVLNVLSSPGSYIYVNGTLAGIGNATIYAPYGSTLNITAARQYTMPNMKIVHLTGPLTISVAPIPLIANLTLSVVSPIPISSVTVSINGTKLTWPVKGTIQLTAGVPYTITILSASPLNYCAPQSTTTIFPPGQDVFTFNCTLRVPVLELFSALPATVEVAASSGPIATINVTPGVNEYLALMPGSYTIVSTTSVTGRAPLSQVVSISSPELYALNVTPPPKAAVAILTAYSNVPYANISVYFSNGTLIASHIGSVSLSLKPGIYIVKASAPGYVNVTKSIMLASGTTNNFLIPLTPYVPPKKSIVPITLIMVGAAVGATAAAAAVGFLLYRRSRISPEELQI